MIKRNPTNKTLWFMAVGSILTASACQDGLSPESQSDEILIINDGGTLDDRVRDLPEDTLEIQPPVDGFVGVAAVRPPDRIRLTRVAEVLPPEVGGHALQATHIATSGTLTYVSYAVAGEPYGGGVDVFSTWRDRPRLVSQALVTSADVFSLSESNGRLYLGASMSNEDFVSPAALGEIRMESGRLTNQYRILDLPSYAATSVMPQDADVYVTTGSSDDGGLFTVDASAWSSTPVELHRDARAVAADDDVMVTMSGTPGTLRMYDTQTGDAVGTYEIGGATVPESKSSVAMANGHVFVAAGDAGLKVVRVSDGAVVAEVGMDRMIGTVDENTVTNGVTVNDELVFLANGGAGLYVLRQTVDQNGDLTLSRVGRVLFPEGISVNFVGSRGRRVFLASGSGGLQIIRIAAR